MESWQAHRVDRICMNWPKKGRLVPVLYTHIENLMHPKGKPTSLSPILHIWFWTSICQLCNNNMTNFLGLVLQFKNVRKVYQAKELLNRLLAFSDHINVKLYRLFTKLQVSNCSLYKFSAFLHKHTQRMMPE